MRKVKNIIDGIFTISKDRKKSQATTKPLKDSVRMIVIR